MKTSSIKAAALSLLSLTLLNCSSKQPATDEAPKPSAKTEKKCATDEELKSRLKELPDLLVQLGGEHKAVRSYRSRPKDFFKEGHSTACRDGTCPQLFTMTLHLPSEADTKGQPKTFHSAVKLLSRQPESNFDFAIDGLNATDSELSGREGDHVFYAKAVDDDHVYVEWSQSDRNSRAGTEQNFLVKIQPSTPQLLRAHVNLQGKGVCGK